ncbi:hypothetical protein BG000_008322 [Podila horticola]|nr:hypothetical protein BG000_008322 [Podila horticola]
MIKPFGDETRIDTSYDPWANVARNISAGNFTESNPVSPLDDDLPQPSRPWNCSRQGSRRSSQSSYAQEFSKDGDRYRPWIWANANNSSYAPSISSPTSMQSPTSMYCDDENTYNTLDRESLRVKSRYREMKEIQLRPYGQDDEDEVGDVADDVTESSYADEPVHTFDNPADTHDDLQDVDVDALNPYKQALKDDYDSIPASDVSLSEESQQELYRMAFASSPASARIHQYRIPPEYGHYYPDTQHQQPRTLNPSATSTSIASSSTLKSRGRASLTRTRTVLRQVKRRVSAAAQTVVTQANQALVRKGTESSLNQSPVEERQLWIREEEEEEEGHARDENEYAQHLDDSRHIYQSYDQHNYSSDVYHDNHGEHDDPTSPMYENHYDNNNSGSLGGSRSGSSNSIRRNLYSASRSSLHKSKILLRQVKRRVSNAAQSMVLHAGNKIEHVEANKGERPIDHPFMGVVES